MKIFYPINFSLFLYLSLAIIIPCFMVFVACFLGEKSSGKNRDTPFESGIVSTGNTKIRFSIKFYLIAIFFVIFDVESLYLYCWSIVVQKSGWIGFLEAFLFIFMILIGLVYLHRTKSFK